MLGLLGIMEIGGKFSFIVCQERGGIASAFCRGVSMERIKIPFLISDVCACNQHYVAVSILICSRVASWVGLA
jgi:hypothetical protein